MCEPVGPVSDDWDLYIVSTGVWMNRDRTLISYAPLADEVRLSHRTHTACSTAVQEVLEYKKRPDAIAFQKAKVCTYT